jgi:glyoxylase-like metal-dependent hydrolase (beta-lactamase superfamily II)
MALHWDESPVILEHHPGPTIGAMWVILQQEKVVFVGDLVAKNQPPFLAHADLPPGLKDWSCWGALPTGFHNRE